MITSLRLFGNGGFTVYKIMTDSAKHVPGKLHDDEQSQFPASRLVSNGFEALSA